MLFIFDMGGVVTNTFMMDSMCKKLNLTREMFFEVCKLGNRNIWEEFECGEIGTVEFWKLFNLNSQKFGNEKMIEIPLVERDLFRMFFHPSKNVETVEIINELKAKGHRVICGTNTIQSHYENHMERGDYLFFNQTYASNKIGVAKPNPEFFSWVLEAEGYSEKPDQVFFTDDKIENVRAAESVGINAVQFITAKNFREYLVSMKVL